MSAVEEKRLSDDGKYYTLKEFIVFCGEEDGKWYWSQAKPEKRISDDGQAYTLNEFIEFSGEEDGKWYWSQAKPANEQAATPKPATSENLAAPTQEATPKPATSENLAAPTQAAALKPATSENLAAPTANRTRSASPAPMPLRPRSDIGCGSMSPDVAAAIVKIDTCIDRMEKSLEKIDLFQNKPAKLPGAEFDLLKELEVARDTMLEWMKKTATDRTKLEEMFGGDCARIRRVMSVFEVLDEKPLSNMNRNDQRLKGAHDACDSVIKVLEDIGYAWLLNSKVTYANKAGQPFTGNAFTVGTSLEPIMPQASATDFQTFVIGKELPPGLTLNPSTGEITGTPTAEWPPTEYTVTCKGTGKPVDCKLLITVNPKPIFPPEKIVYSPASLTYIKEKQSSAWKPKLTGGDPADEFQIVPALPEGLFFDTTTGTISGAPTQLTDLSVYSVTAKNKGGATHTKITLEVNPNNTEVAKIIGCTTPEELMAFEAEVEELKKNKKPFNWMIWMCHRAHLNDPTLTRFDFTNLRMPTGLEQPLISPKLVVAMAANSYIEELLLSSTSFQNPEAVVLAQSLQQNTKLRILNIDSNHLSPLALELLCKGIGINQTLEQLRCNNVPAGYPVFEAVAGMVKSNNRIVKIGMEIKDPEMRRQTDNQLMKNNDEARKRRVAENKAKKEAEEAAKKGGYPAAS